MNQPTTPKINKVNEILAKGEPENITVDNYTKYTGYKLQYIVDAMNEVFGIGNWGFEETQTHTIKEEEKAALAVSNVSVWVGNMVNKMSAWGGSRITRGNIADAKKGAQTDALKKGLSYFSIGSKAYKGLLKK